MTPILLFFLAVAGYFFAYHTYGRYLARKVFKLNSRAVVPAKQFADGKDFVASSKHVMFGHHFTSIAGTGPIVGPAIGVIWGWGPAMLWIFFGSIFLGAVHDFGALIVSVRNEGKSLSDIAGRYINRRVRLMFFIIVFLALLIVIAIFGLVIAIIFEQFPQSVWAVWLEIPIAIGFGYLVFRRKYSLAGMTLLAVGLMYVFVYLGAESPLRLSPFFELPTTGLWTVILLIYAFIASVLPVGLLLQPRDYLNAWQLYVAMGLIVLGLIWTSLTKTFPLVAPVINLQPEGAPSMWPFLFITIACGAVSGFHCLVCSGTSSKQISSEQDTQFVGYGSMMMEAALATLIVVAVCAGIGLGYDSGSGIVTGSQAWQSHYGSWQSSAGLGSKLTAVVLGCANMMGSFGMPYTVSVAIVGVFIASFAGTTLDSASRVQRYIISELMTCIGVPRLSNKWIATTIAIVSAACLAFSTGADGKGALQLWPLFGAVNQLLAGLALMVITAYIRSRSGSLWTASIAGGPCLILMIITIWASVSNQIQYISEGKLLLSCINLSILILAVFMSFETVLSLSGKAIDREARS